jgi:hypothetical protein
MKQFVLAGVTSLSLIVSSAAMAEPVVRAGASNSPAQALSLDRGRVGAPRVKESALAGGNGLGIAMLALVLAGAAWGAYEMIDGDSEGVPDSN